LRVLKRIFPPDDVEGYRPTAQDTRESLMWPFQTVRSAMAELPSYATF